MCQFWQVLANVQYFGFKANKPGKPRQINSVICNPCRRQIINKMACATNLQASQNPGEYAKVMPAHREDDQLYNQPIISDA